MMRSRQRFVVLNWDGTGVGCLWKHREKQTAGGDLSNKPDGMRLARSTSALMEGCTHTTRGFGWCSF